MGVPFKFSNFGIPCPLKELLNSTWPNGLADYLIHIQQLLDSSEYP